MTDYTKLTDFASKDTLPTGNAAKIVKGTEIDDEFEAIETAVATKADLNSPDLTGTPTAPTASTGVDTTQIATTAFVQQEITANERTTATLIDTIYPVGSIYISTVSTNPGTLFGQGTWEAFATGKTLVGIDSGDTDFDTVEETGGAKTDSKTISISRNGWGTSGGSVGSIASGSLVVGSGLTEQYETLESIRRAGNNLSVSFDVDTVPPYIVTYMWKRTA